MIKELSVIVPAYNEEKVIAQTLEEIASYLRSKGYRFEVLVVDDGSTDSTIARIRPVGERYPEIRLLSQERNAGKGMAVKRGIAEAKMPLCLFIDADNSTSIREWDKFEPLFEQGARVVIASRRVPGADIVHDQPWIRRFLGTGYRVLARGMFGLSVNDFNCGFKAYETKLAKDLYAQVRLLDWAFDVEVFCLLKKKGISVSEVPVRWEHSEKKSNLAPMRAAIKTFSSLLELKKNY